MNKEETLAENIIYDGRILKLHVDVVELPDGKTSIRECVDHKDGAGILVVRDGEIYFVKQYRYAIGEEVIEIPAGLMEAGEDPKETAERELQEEIGLKPLDLREILTIYPSPGFTDEKTHIFYASSFEENSLKADDDEFLTILKYKIEDVREMFRDGVFKDAKTVSALGYYFSELSK